MNASDPFDLQRFVQAQASVFATAANELMSGRKMGHWIWFIFPQLDCLGRSETAHFYGITGLPEARAYLAHPLLGQRLRHACGLLMALQSSLTAVQVLGHVDALKLRSSMTLFVAASPTERLFKDVLQRFFGAQADPLTLTALAAS